MTISKAKEAFIHGFGYPVYAVDVVGRNALVVAGGGGAVKTGVPNRIDVVEVQRCLRENIPNARITAGLDTGTEAVMSLTATNVSGCDSFVTSLEGRSCVEYFVTRIKSHTQAVHNLSESVVDNGNARSNTNEPQPTDACVERMVRKRKCSSHDPIDEPSSLASHLPTEKSEQDQSDLIQWNLTKLRQFTLPSIGSSCTNQVDTITNTGAKRTRTASSSASGMPTCVATGGPTGSWFAVGSDIGSVFLFDRMQTDEPTTDMQTRSSDSMKPFFVYSDVSCGMSAGVCALALTTTKTRVATPESQSDSPIIDLPFPCLATICEQPSWSVVHVWYVNNLVATSSSPLPQTLHQNNDGSSRSHPRKAKTSSKTKKVSSSTKGETHFFSSLPSDADVQRDNVPSTLQPFAVACCSQFSTGSTPPPSPVVPNRESITERSSYRFKHCQFLRCHLDPSSFSMDQATTTTSRGKAHTSQPYEKLSSLLLVTTMQPLCANRKSVSRVIVWSVPVPTRSFGLKDHQQNSKSSNDPLRLSPLTDIALPSGDLPACLTVHPSRSRSLIGVGTMDGRVEVYFLSPRTRVLTCVYSLKDAHPIFVTSLTFLPMQSPQASNSTSSPANSSKRVATVPTLSSELSYDLVSVSVDRMLRWHPGPSYTQVDSLARGIPADPTGLWGRGKRFMITMLTYLGLIFFIPILLSLMDTMCYGQL